MRKRLLAATLAALLGQPALAQDTKLPLPQISEELTLQRQSIPVLDSTMTYLDSGSGAPVLFLHGNPTSAYLWRNILPYVADTNRAVAVDLIGMGGSGKPDIAYTFDDHARYLEAFIDAMGFETLTLVGHDWGGALAWDYARRHPGRVDKLAFMEAVAPPAMPQPSFEAMGEDMGGMFRAFKDEATGRQMVIEENFFVEQVLPALVNRPLGEAAMAEYRAPYREKQSRWPTLAWPREVPIAGQPASSVQLMADIGAFMEETEMPVLLLYAEPGILVSPAAVGWYRERISGLETVFVGQGLHFIQEDQPDAIGRALEDWMHRH